MKWRLRRPEGERSPVREAAIRYVAIGLVAVALISIVGRLALSPCGGGRGDP